MVQIKSAAALLVAAAAIAPALAQSYYYEDSALVSREDLEDLADILARDYGYDIEARDFDDMEELDMRELYDELYEREPIFQHIKNIYNKLRGKGGEAHRHEHGGSHEHQGHLGEHHGEHHAFGAHPGFGHEHHSEFAHHGGSPDAAAAAPQPPSDPSQTQYGRSYDDMEEFEARDVEPDYEELLSRYFDDLYERELAAEDEYTQIAARAPLGDDFDVELVQRSPEPNVLEWLKNLFHPHHKKDDKKKKEEAEKKKKEAEEKSKTTSTTTADPSKSTDKSTGSGDDSSTVDAREFAEYWYDLD